MVNCLVFSNCYIRHCKNWYLQYFCLIKKRKMLEIIIIIIIVFLKLWHCQIIWYLFACFKVIILGSFHSIWFVKYVFSAKLRFVKPSTRLVKYESRVLKSNPELVNNSIVDHLEQCGLFSVFHNGFRSSQSTADLLKVVSDRIARAFNRSGTTGAVAEFGRLVFFTNLSIMEFQVSYSLFSVINCFEWFWMESLRKSIKFMLQFPKAPFLVLCFFYYHLWPSWWCYLWCYQLPMLMLLLSILSVIRHLICGNNLDWLLNLNLICETL